MSTSPTAADLRKQRLEALLSAVNDYIGKERTRLQNEKKSLQAILDGRTGGKGIQKDAQEAVSAAAGNDLNYYLAGKET